MSRFKAWGIYRVTTFLFIAAIFCSFASGKTIYVDNDAAGANDGSSWVDAHIYLQEALAEAASAEKPVEIRVAQGTYKPSEGLVAIPEFDWRTTTFQLINGVTLKGGYAGTTAHDPNARDIELHETILSGDLNGDDAEIADLQNLVAEPTRSENSYHVITGSGTDASAVINGFVITGGNANVSGESNNSGGGMRNEAGSPTVINCTFVANSAIYGGAIGNFNADPTVTNCTLVGNSAGSGAGMDNVSSEPKLSNCTFYGNTSVDDAGAIRNIASAPVLINSILWGNTSPQLAGDAAVSYSDVQGGWPGEGNIDADPLFADADNGDYHLKSQAGRWDAESGSWVLDGVTSPCIDAGDPGSPVAAEPYPNGLIVNMGAYGGTAQASKSPSGEHSRYGGGIGEPNDPWQIYTAEQMNTIGLHEEDWDKHFRLMADIDLAAYTGTSFNVIGGYTYWQENKPFSGTFNGGGHTISNFTYSVTDVNEIAIFAYVRGLGAAIMDLGLIDPNVIVSGRDVAPVDFNDPGVDPNDPNLYIGTGDSVASLVGHMESGTISGCYVRGGRISGKDWVGGLVAYNEGLLFDCYSDVEVNGGTDVGGLVGVNAKDGVVISCRSLGNILGKRDVGGLIGSDHMGGTILDSYSAGRVVGEELIGGLVGTSQGLISCCNSEGDIIGSASKIGGLAGQSYGQVSDCYATGSVSGIQEVGGLVGYSRGSVVRSCSTSEVIGAEIGGKSIGGLVGGNSAVIISCFSAGSVYGDTVIGGLVGVNMNTITNSYSIGTVNGYSRVGGLAGQNLKGGSIMNCYAAGSVTEDAGDEWVGGLVGWNVDSYVIASFWDVQTTGQATSDGGTGMTTAEMQSASTFLEADWDFVDERRAKTAQMISGGLTKAGTTRDFPGK